MNLTNKGSSTGNATITGLPFAAVGDVYWNLARSANITLTSSADLAYAAVADPSTTLIIQEADTSGTAAGLSDVDFATNSILTVTGGYVAGPLTIINLSLPTNNQPMIKFPFVNLDATALQ